jgi:two-component system, NarL family, sensor histidine kinase UhpB
VRGTPISLRLRLIISIALVLIVILLPGSVIVYWHALHEVDVEMRAAVAVGENTVHNAVDDAEEADGPLLRHLELLVADFDGNRHLRASLVGRNGQVLYQSSPKLPSDPAPAWFYTLLAAQPIKADLDLPYPFTHVGAIVLETDSHNEISEVWGDATLTLAILVIFCGLNAVLVYWVTGRALRPLDAVSEGFNGLGAGNYALRVEERGPRELALLCRGFNQMAEQLAQAEDRKHRLEHQLAAVQEEERSELARDLHDEIGPLLFAVGVDLSVVQYDEAVRDTAIAPRIESIRESIARMYKDVKAILGRLRPATLVDLGLLQAAENLVSFWQPRYPKVEFHLQVPVERFGMPTDDAIYHLILESFSNALRHGQPSRIDVSVTTVEEYILVSIKDNGTGLKPQRNAPGFGLIGMQERVQSLGGTLTVQNCATGGGVVVSARIPLPAEEGIAGPIAGTPARQAVQS